MNDHGLWILEVGPVGRFWDEATASAGREFGARNYRWFVAARVGRRVIPVFAGMAALAGIVLGIAWLAENWAMLYSTVAGWVVAAAPWLLWAVLVAVGVAAAGAFSVLVWRTRWRWSGWRPTDLVPIRYRRY